MRQALLLLVVVAAAVFVFSALDLSDVDAGKRRKHG
jgi:hypothetical protein